MKKDFDIRLVSIRELDSKNKFNRWEIMLYKGAAINVGLTASINPLINNNILNLILGISYKSESKYYLRYYVSFDYEIPNLIEYIEEKENLITFPAYMLTIMMSVALGTIRGMLNIRLSHTRLGDYPLPILNVTEIIESLNLSKVSTKTASPMFRFVYE